MYNFIDTPLPKLEQVTDSNGLRYYVTPEGRKYPSITTMLGTGDKPQLDAWKERLGPEESNKVGRIARVRGKAMHKLCENHFLGKENDAIMPSTMQLWRQVKPLLAKVDNIRCIEQALYSDQLELSGTPDLVADWMQIPSVVDYKTAAKIKSVEWITDYFIQTTGYTLMYEERTGIPINQIVIIIAVEQSNDAQVFVRNKNDYMSLLNDRINIFRESDIRQRILNA